jgi:hypothetical protein
MPMHQEIKVEVQQIEQEPSKEKVELEEQETYIVSEEQLKHEKKANQ